MSNTLVVDPHHRDEYLQELRIVLPQARALAACLSLEVGEVTDRSGTFVLSERWRNGEEYLTEVLQLPFYRRYLERTEPWYSAPREVLVLSSVF